MAARTAARTWTIFDLVCLEYPEIRWEQDMQSITSFQGGVIREVPMAPLKAVFCDD